MAYQNPFRSIYGPTWAAGSSTNVISALQHPDESARAKDMAMMRNRMGLGPPPLPLGPTAGFSYGGSREHSGGGGLTEAPLVHGYEGGGISTRDFTNATGRAPTAGDVEMANGGGLAPAHPQMGSLDSYYQMAHGMSPWQALQGPNRATPPQAKSPALYDKPFAGPDATDFPQDIQMAADGGDIAPGRPVIVGERGPELIMPKQDATVIPNEYLPTRHLLSGNILDYLKRFLR